MDGLTICDSIGCTTDHRDQIDKAYYRIEYPLKEEAALYAFNKRKKFTPVAGWHTRTSPCLHEEAGLAKDAHIGGCLLGVCCRVERAL